MGRLRGVQPRASGAYPEAALRLPADTAPEPLNDDGSDQGFVNSFLVFFFFMYKCICYVSILSLNKKRHFQTILVLTSAVLGQLGVARRVGVRQASRRREETVKMLCLATLLPGRSGQAQSSARG